MPVGTKPGAKMQLTREPALPSKCIGCGFSADGKREFLDPNVSEDYYGAIVFCIYCCREMADALGYVTEEEEVAAVAKMEEAIQEQVLLNEKLEAIQNVLSTYGFNDGLDTLLVAAERINLEREQAEQERAESEQRDSVSEEPSDGPSESSSKF